MTPAHSASAPCSPLPALSLGLLHGPRLDVDLDAVADEQAAGLEGLVPDEACWSRCPVRVSIVAASSSTASEKKSARGIARRRRQLRRRPPECAKELGGL